MKKNSLNSPPKDHPDLSRRTFLKGALSAGVLAGFPTIIPSSALGLDGSAPPSERALVGIIGCGARSSEARFWDNPKRSEVVALADPFARRRENWKTKYAPDRSLREYNDFRELLSSDVDIVHISTGDYWHVTQALMAARAGKHLFVEKPLGLSIEQDLACREIAQDHNVQFQYGTQQRASVYTRGAVELVLNGHIGDVQRAFLFGWEGVSGGKCEPSTPPPDIDYDLWLGPAPEAPYCKARVETSMSVANGIYHVYDYSIGFVAGWGAHPYDQMQWWLDEAGVGMPVSVEATGTIPTEGFFNTLVTWDALLRYKNGFEARFCDEKTITKYLDRFPDLKVTRNGVIFEGTKGWIYTSREGWAASSPEILAAAKDPGPKRLVVAGGGVPATWMNLLDAIEGKNKVVSPLSSAIASDISCHLVDLAVRHGGKLQWDDEKKTIVGNDAAKKAIHRPMRAPWDVLNPKYTG